jgi:DNA-binding NarL/FixJ family response regulator
MIKLFIADDHNIVITGIRSMLEDVEDIRVVGEASSGAEVLELVAQSVARDEFPDLILMDIKMPGKTGIEATTELTERYPGIKIMALTMYDDEEYVTSMLQAGARGYVLKNTGKPELLAAIRRVAAGETYFSKEATAAVMNRYMSKPKADTAPHPGRHYSITGEELPEVPLTRREQEILKLIASELTNQEIADRLFISPRTVHSHRRNLMQKVGVKNTAGLVRYAIKHGLFQ